ncbi:RING-H2 finger protein ATL63 [Cardamine amara subsp. amara]|uniref:RING-type E3 ubiquitin transferase n=1 Tax=Cardamine amara subsp. amara TaxID=228776 RepID=A0ABD0ZRI7_CARAN
MSEEDDSMNVRSNLSSFFEILSSYNSNVLLAALVFLLLVVLFVLLLHFYARSFWSPSHQDISAVRRHRRRRRNRRRTVTTTRIIPSVLVGGFDGEVSSPAPAVVAVAQTSDDKGLDSSVISSIPLFVYEEDGEDEEEECVICLGLWEVGDFGRKLRNCGHGFHVECIDMWLSSHSTCPLCRSPVLAVSDEVNLKMAVNVVEEEEQEVRMQLSPAGEDDRRFSLSLAVMDKTGVNDVDGDSNGVGEGEVRIEVLDEEINGGGLRSEWRSMSMTSSASSSLMRMLSSRSERNKVFPSARQDSSS